MLESTEINHKEDFAHCKECDDINMSIGFKLLITRFYHCVIILKCLRLLLIIKSTLKIAVSITFKYWEGKKRI